MNRAEITLTTPTETQLYSDAVAAGGFVYTTGQMPLLPDGAVVSEDFETQARHAFASLGAVLEAAGSSAAQIVRLTVYLADINDVGALAPVRRDFLGDSRPASVIVQVGAFGTPGMRLEVEAVALASHTA